MDVGSTTFRRRWADVPTLGVGLSVDVYSPDLFDVVASLDAAKMPCGYFEVFKATGPALADVRRRMANAALPYHGEGLWLTHPNLLRDSGTMEALTTVVEHGRILDSPWINLECASKSIAGYQFGTYLPPPFTPAMADVIARNASALQEYLEPVLLLELPPLTYFGYGELSPALFFRRIAQQAPCGFVLDIGHLWTHWRYGAERMPLRPWLHAFLRDFPLERVVEIHVAGLDRHPCDDGEPDHQPPRWLDAHPAAIPEVLFEMLEAVLQQPRLSSLRGVALEVDGKDIDVIVQEFGDFQRRFGSRVDAAIEQPKRCQEPFWRGERFLAPFPDSSNAERMVREYAETAVGARPVECHRPWYGDVARYQRAYLPYEILTWGGDLEAMFPETCRVLDRHGVPAHRFVSWWFEQPRPSLESYDFFLLKLERFVDFVTERLPIARAMASAEAELLRRGYLDACNRITDEVTA
jgi:uncharacterized protein